MLEFQPDMLHGFDDSAVSSRHKDMSTQPVDTIATLFNGLCILQVLHLHNV